MKPITEYSTFVFQLNNNTEDGVISRKSQWLVGRSLSINSQELNLLFEFFDLFNSNIKKYIQEIITHSGNWFEMWPQNVDEILTTLLMISESFYEVNIDEIYDKIKPDIPLRSHENYLILFKNISDFFSQMRIENNYHITCFMGK